MADLNGWLGEDKFKEEIGIELIADKTYLAQHWGVRSSSGNAGFDREAPTEALLGAISVRVDVSTKQKTDYVGIAYKQDIRVGDSLTVFVDGGKKKKLAVSAVSHIGDISEVELKNG